MHRPEDVNALTDPLVSIARECDTTVILSMHTNANGGTMGRRLDGAGRSVMTMTRPDPSQPNRRRLEIVGNFKQESPLGITMRDGGCDYDLKPPDKPTEESSGRMATSKRMGATEFIRKALTDTNDQTWNALMSAWEDQGGAERTFRRAFDTLKDSGKLVVDGGFGTGQRMIVHLVKDEGADA
jgi:hypothetical protein